MIEEPFYSTVNLWCTTCIFTEPSANKKHMVVTKGWVSNLSVPQIAEIDDTGEFTPDDAQMRHLMTPGDHQWEIQDWRVPKGQRRAYG